MEENQPRPCMPSRFGVRLIPSSVLRETVDNLESQVGIVKKGNGNIVSTLERKTMNPELIRKAAGNLEVADHGGGRSWGPAVRNLGWTIPRVLLRSRVELLDTGDAITELQGVQD